MSVRIQGLTMIIDARIDSDDFEIGLSAWNGKEWVKVNGEAKINTRSFCVHISKLFFHDDQS